MHLSFRQTFFTLGTLIGLVFILYIARTLLIPLTFALLISLILYPMIRWLTRKGVGIVWSIILTLISLTILIAAVIFFFSSQMITISKELDGFLAKLKDLYFKVLTFINDKINIVPDLETSEIKSKLLEKLGESGLPIVSDTLSFTGTFLSFMVLTFIYVFLILLHHKMFARAITHAAPEEYRNQFFQTLKEAQKVGQQYLTGMGALMLILGCLNSIGLLLLGIDYAFFFGFLAALLAIIPYIGTTLGGLIPTLYAFMTYDSYWYPIGVILIFWFVQTLEGNFLNPRIVGGNLNLNAMTALISLIAGGFLWGISGMILFLPLAAIFKVFCENYDELKPLAMLMGDSDKTEKEGIFTKIKKKVKN